MEGSRTGQEPPRLLASLVVRKSSPMAPPRRDRSSSSSSSEGPALFAAHKPASSSSAPATKSAPPARKDSKSPCASSPLSSSAAASATTVSKAPADKAMVNSFEQLGLDEWAVTNLARLNLFKPTPVQTYCVPPILAGASLVVALAPTGSGKTAAFALPILTCLARDPFGIFALVLTPTRELAIQISEQFEALGAPVRCNCQVIIGGMAIVPQQSALAKLPHIVVATPGRLADHIHSASPPRLQRVRFLVLDEADRLLTSTEGFTKDLKTLASKLSPPSQRQTIFVSATLSGTEVPFAKELGLIAVDKPDFEWRADVPTATVSTLKQDLILVPTDAKHAYFAWFLRKYGPLSVIESSKLAMVSSKAAKRKKKTDPAGGAATDDENAEERCHTLIVFTSSCESCQLYHEICVQLQIPSAPLHSQLSQGRRLAGLAKFRQGAVCILVATDVASRGLDIPTVDLVLNLDVPREPVNYIHRVGRAARAGRAGRSITFVTAHEVELVKAVEKVTKAPMSVVDADEEQVALVLHKASAAKRAAAMQMHDDGFQVKDEGF